MQLLEEHAATLGPLTEEKSTLLSFLQKICTVVDNMIVSGEGESLVRACEYMHNYMYNIIIPSTPKKFLIIVCLSSASLNVYVISRLSLYSTFLCEFM